MDSGSYQQRYLLGDKRFFHEEVSKLEADICDPKIDKRRG